MRITTTRVNEGKDISITGRCKQEEYRSMYEVFQVIEHKARIYRAESWIYPTNLPTCISFQIHFKTSKQCNKFEQAIRRA